MSEGAGLRWGCRADIGSCAVRRPPASKELNKEYSSLRSNRSFAAGGVSV